MCVRRGFEGTNAFGGGGGGGDSSSSSSSSSSNLTEYVMLA